MTNFKGSHIYLRHIHKVINKLLQMSQNIIFQFFKCTLYKNMVRVLRTIYDNFDINIVANLKV